MRRLLDESEGQPGRDDEGDRQRNQHADRGVDRDRAHVWAHQAGDEGHRQQRGDHGEGGEDGGAAHLVDRARNDGFEAIVVEAHAAVNVFHHHDGVVDQDADRENQREQRHPVQREAPGPRSEQRGRQRQQHRGADDQRLAAADGEQHQQHYRAGGEDQLLDQLLGLVVGSGAVVAGDADLDSFGQDAAMQRVHALDYLFGNVDRVFARFLGDGQRHRREGLALVGPVRAARARGVPDITRRLVGAGNDAGHVRHVDRATLRYADHQLLDVLGAGEEGAGLHQDFLVARHQRAGRLHRVGHLQRVTDVLRRHVEGRHAVRVHQHPHRAAGAAEGGDFAGAGDAFQLDFRGVRHLLQLVGTACLVARPQGDGDDGDVVDAERLDDGFADAEFGRHPVAVGLDGVVQPHQRLRPVLAHQVLHGQHGHAGFGHRIDVLDAGDLRQHLLGRGSDQRFHVPRRGAGEGDEDVGHGHVDLWLFLARRWRCFWRKSPP